MTIEQAVKQGKLSSDAAHRLMQLTSTVTSTTVVTTRVESSKPQDK